MQISQNTSAMPAGITVATDNDGRDSCVIVVKGTFSISKDGRATLAEKQEPLVYADEHYGDPGNTSIKYECDFAPFKPRADVIVHGHAVSPNGRPVTEMMVALQIGSLKKEIRVVGDRQWENGIIGVRASEPQPFLKMPLVFERAFGGSDHSHENPKHQGTELRNPVGAGFHRDSDRKSIAGMPLPNLEDARQPVQKWSDTPAPVGFGIVGRNWQPRIQHAGTYDDKWLKERFPFLPEDFDPQHFLSAPADQQISFFKGGEVVRCFNMTADKIFTLAVPKLDVPVLFRFRDREVLVEPKLDTLIVEPDERRCLLTWRASVPLGRKLNALREVLVGKQPATPPKRTTNGKQHFSSLAEFIDWKKGMSVSVDE